MSMNPAEHPSFQAVLSTVRGQVQNYLDKSDEVIAEVARTAPAGVSERMTKLIARKGKKIRSTILALIATSGETPADESRIAHACAGIELLHLASLVHDDIIDETTMRRGERTAHVEWGNKVAVLIGDYILSQAMRCVIDEESREIPLILSSAANSLIVGEISELDHTGNMNLPLADYNAIIKGKTAALVEASAKIGATIAGFDAERIEACGKIGTHFGLAFQIIDDLLDYGIGATNLDKAKFTDISNGLVTLPLIYYFESVSPEEKPSLQALLKGAADPGVAEEICKRLEEAKAFDKAKETALQHIADAMEIADTLPMTEHTSSLKSFLYAMAERGN